MTERIQSADAPRGAPRGALSAALRRLGSRLRGNVWLFGLGTVVGVLSLWLVFSFVADYVLHVPRWVRLGHLAVFIGLGVYFGWRELGAKLRRVPDRRGLALIAERSRPELDALLVSAVEFEAAPPADPAVSVRAERVVAEANRIAPQLDFTQVVSRAPAFKRLAAGAALALALGAGLAADRERGAIFFERFLGGQVPWPQRTLLEIEIRLAEGQARIERDGDVIRAAVPRSIDVPIAVIAEGQAPESVRLVFASGSDLVLSPTAGGGFGTVLRSVGEPLEFWAVGGDDRDRAPRVELTVLDPPDLSGLAIRITPPEYSGLAPSLSHDTDARALIGSRIEVAVTVDPPGATGAVRLLPTDELRELEPLEFEGPDGVVAPGLGFEFVLERDVRLRFELVDESGLENPEPGLIAIDAIEDRPPEVELLAPGRSDVESIAGGALALRAAVRDDFGLTAVRWRARESASEAWQVEAPLPTVELPSEDGTAVIGFERIEISALAAAAGELASGDPVGLQFVIQASATDTGQNPQVGDSVPVRLRVLSSDEFLRRLQDRLAAARIDATELGGDQRDARSRTDELLASVTEEGGAGELDVRALQKTLNAQRRVGADAEALLRELTSVAEQVLYARLEEGSDALLDRFEAATASGPKRLERRFDSAPWSELLAAPELAQDGEVGLTTHLLVIVGIALELAEGRAAAADDALDEALAAGGGSPTREALARAVLVQGEFLDELENLLDRLAEWDNLQSVVGLARDLLRRQKALQERTVRYAK